MSRGVTRPAVTGTVGVPGVELLGSLDAVEAVVTELDLLRDRCRGPVTAGTAWVRSRLAGAPAGARPWAVAIRDPAGQLEAAAVLLDLADDGGAIRTELASGGDGYTAALLSNGPQATERLAQTLATGLAARPVAGPVRLGPLAVDEVSQRVFSLLPATVRVEPLDPVPAVRATVGGVLSDYLSPAVLRTLRKARNRLLVDGVVALESSTVDPGSVAEQLPAMAQAFRDRDHWHGLVSLLDTPAGRARWTDQLLALADSGELELSTLHLDGCLAAYVVGLLDGSTFRVLDGRFVTRWARYAPGRLLEASVLSRVLATGRTSVDWMTAVAPETLIAANDASRRVMLALG